MKGNFDGPFDIVVFTENLVKPKAVDSNMMKLFHPLWYCYWWATPPPPPPAISLVLRFKTSWGGNWHYWVFLWIHYMYQSILRVFYYLILKTTLWGRYCSPWGNRLTMSKIRIQIKILVWQLKATVHSVRYHCFSNFCSSDRLNSGLPEPQV